MSNIKLNLRFKFWMTNIEYQTKSNIQILMPNIEYQTKSNIQIECRISNIKLNPTHILNIEYVTL